MSQPEQHPQPVRGGFFKALLKDSSANTLAIGAAAMVPLVAMVGGGVDASRFYMAQARLQAACDAGALAGRRAMQTTNFTGSQTENPNDPSPQDISNTFFDENYPEETFGMKGLQRSYTADENGVVTGTASGNMPTTLMGIFGYADIDLNVTCAADINISNTDIMFVLDVTGSMQCTPTMTAAECSPVVQWSNVQDSFGNDVAPSTDSRMFDLQEAAKDFYATVAESTSSQAQVRYGFVPYSSTVNVGRIVYAEDPSWMATEANYQSREPVFDEEWEETDRSRFFDYSNFGDEVDDGFEQWGRGNVTQERCIEFFNEDWNDRDDFADWEEVDGSIDYSTGTTDTPVQVGNTRIISGTGATVTQRRGPGVYIYDADAWPRSNRCRVGWDMVERTAEVSFEIEEELERTFEDWVYRDRTYTIPASLYTGGTISLDTGDDPDTLGFINHDWDGCIEEADTVVQSDFTTVPSTAYDLNINLIPSNNQERWRPQLPSAVFYRYVDGYDRRFSTTDYQRPSEFPPEVVNWLWQNGEMTTDEDKEDLAEFVGSNGARYTCPAEARRLAQMTESEFNTYIESLRAWGATYLDAGMIWGARFMSPNGIFADANTTSSNGAAISRHIVFMTDGQQSTGQSTYGMYGIEFWDRHVTSDGLQASMATNHAARFQAACRAARNENISVWVVAFGESFVDENDDPVVPDNLVDCATPGRSYVARDEIALSETFRGIAQQIAELRLTQ